MNSLKVACLLLVIAYVSAEEFAEDGGFEEFEGHEIADIGHGGHHESTITLHEDTEHGEDYYAHPKYHYNYAVHDPHTGDEKQHHEERDGDSVKGSYTLKEADGTTRVVEYTADKHHGFNAVVHKIGSPNHEVFEEEHEGGH